MAAANSATLRKKVQLLLKKAVSGLSTPSFRASTSDPGKLFELTALGFLLQTAKGKGANVSVTNTQGGALHFAGSPSAADRKHHTFFTIQWPNDPLSHEAWISVEVQTLSESISCPVNSTPKLTFGSVHEIDVGLFEPGVNGHPTHEQLHLGATCKHTPFKKWQLREALGLRRETAYVLNRPVNSLAPWFSPLVSADPASPLIFFSSDLRCLNYKAPVDALGLYVNYLRFPI